MSFPPLIPFLRLGPALLLAGRKSDGNAITISSVPDEDRHTRGQSRVRVRAHRRTLHSDDCKGAMQKIVLDTAMRRWSGREEVDEEEEEAGVRWRRGGELFNLHF